MKKKTLLLAITIIAVSAAGALFLTRTLRKPLAVMTIPEIPGVAADTISTHTVALARDSGGEAPEPAFIEAVPITYHVGEYREIPISDGDVLSIKVSPDGGRIVYVTRRGDSRSISLLDLAEGRAVVLDLGLEDYAEAAWRADGGKIVFAGRKDGIWEIYLYEPHTRKIEQVTSDPARGKSWPRFSPYKFDGHYRIAYVSEKAKRKDIWWVRESGQYDMPITTHKPQYDSSSYWYSAEQAPPAIREGGTEPEWSPSGNLLLYRTVEGYSMLGYSYYKWWTKQTLPAPRTDDAVTWSPNQTAFLLFNTKKGTVSLIDRTQLSEKKQVLDGPVSAIDYFPDGRGFAAAMRKNGRTCIALQPYDDPLGDVANLWMYTYSASQKDKMERNQLLFLKTDFQQIYNLYETERYYCGEVDPNFPARPYLVTSDAVLETFYAAFAALYGGMERNRLASLLKTFSQKALEDASSKQASKDVLLLIETGLGLLDPGIRPQLSADAAREISRVENAAGYDTSLWGKYMDYGEFSIRGKYQSDTLMQGYFRAVKWYQAFTLALDSLQDRERAAEINAIANSPDVRPSLEAIHGVYRDIVGESRYFNPLNLKTVPQDAAPAQIAGALPWIRGVPAYRLFPTVYTLDAYVFDELITHLDRPGTVGTPENPRLLPKGLDVMAGLGSPEAFEILINEFKEDRFANYRTTLTDVRKKIEGFDKDTWNTNVYQQWLYALQALVMEPVESGPAFTRTAAWKRKQLNTALGSWVNLRYETIAVVERVAAECGEGGYERLNVGKPKGYVEPNPEFYQRLDDGLAAMGRLLLKAYDDSALAAAAESRVSEYRGLIQNLKTMARKELEGKPLSDEEYGQILEIGGAIEQFILIMGSLNGGKDEHAVRLPDPISKIVDIQKDPTTGDRLYEALGNANEINVAVPYYGRRQIAKGPVYSYYEFASGKDWDNQTWRKDQEKTPPRWIAGLQDGDTNPPLYKHPDLKHYP